MPSWHLLEMRVQEFRWLLRVVCMLRKSAGMLHACGRDLNYERDPDNQKKSLNYLSQKKCAGAGGRINLELELLCSKTPFQSESKKCQSRSKKSKVHKKKIELLYAHKRVREGGKKSIDLELFYNEILGRSGATQKK